MYRKELLKIVSENDLANLFLYKWKLYTSKVKLTEHGHENVSLVVDDKYILQIIKPDKTRARLESVISAIEYLYKRNINVPEIVRTPLDEQYASLQIEGMEIYAILMVKIEGEHPNVYSKDQMISTARGMARLHFATTDLASNFDRSKPVEFRIENYSQINRKIIKNEKVQDFLDDMKELRIDCSKCSIAIVHGDMHDNNLLFRNTVLVGILDFDDFFLGPAVYDVAVYLYELNKNLKEQKWIEAARAFIKEYTRNFELNPNDFSNLIDLMRYRNFSVACFFSVYTGVDKFDWTDYIKFNNFIKSVDIQSIL